MGAQSSGTALAQRHTLEYTFNSAYTNSSDRSEHLIQEKGVDFAEYGNGRLTFKCDLFSVGTNCPGTRARNSGTPARNSLKIHRIFLSSVIG